MDFEDASQPSDQLAVCRGKRAGRTSDACNLCHLDKTLQWTADALQRHWHRAAAPERRRQDNGASLVSLPRRRRPAGRGAKHGVAAGAAGIRCGVDGAVPAQLLDDP
jgi:hypothetical protein